jgi:RNA polymerase sigma-70 factor, ECF subfamily
MGAEGNSASIRAREDPRVPPVSASHGAPPKDLESLMSGYQDANQDAARALIERVSPVLLRYFRVQESSRRHAEDLLQETWMRVHMARHTYRRGEPVLPWIFAIARYAGLDRHRKVRRVEGHEIQVDILPQAASAPDPDPSSTAPDIDVLLATLPASQREVIVMLKITGMSIEEVARATASSVGSVKQKAHRAYEKLRAVFAGKWRANEA